MTSYFALHLFVGMFMGVTMSVTGACTACNNLPSVPPGYVQTSYQSSDEHVVNPRRGFTTIINGRASAFNALTVSQLTGLRDTDGQSLVWRQYILDTSVSSDIPTQILTLIRQDMDVIRQAKFTAVIRFMYTDIQRAQAPYGDATKTWMLRHVTQLSPIFFDYEDVIDVVQAGFIGTWGEWYYTTYFGDPNFYDWDDPNNIRGMTSQHWQDRREVHEALLAGTPLSMQVQLRVPQYKQVIIGDNSPTTQAEMIQRTNKARSGHHNDCFLASNDDYGTYINKTAEYPYMTQDNNYAYMGGETCSLSVDDPDRHKCPTATKELSELHFTYLNQAYNQDVLDTWRQDGCYNEIHRRMGYRLALTRSVLPTTVHQDSKFCFRVELLNQGYAAPYRQYVLRLWLRNINTRVLFAAVVEGVDTRLWLSGSPQVIDHAVHVPATVPLGTYEVLLSLDDSQHMTESDYSILLANQNGVPEYVTGLNNLRHQLQVAAVPDGSGDPTCVNVVSSVAPSPSTYNRLYCGLGGCGQASECAVLAIVNPSFETTGSGWEQYGVSGFQYTTSTSWDGLQSISVTNGGALQVFILPPATRGVQLTAYSHHTGTGNDSDNYSIYCDFQYTDNTWSYGNVARFTIGNNQWHRASLVFNANKDIREAWCYAMFRNTISGTSYFDNFKGWTSTSAITDCSTN